MQKITNQEIAKLRRKIGFNRLFYPDNMTTALYRLEELEAKEHERRWRKISDEGLPTKAGGYEFLDDDSIVDWNITNHYLDLEDTEVGRHATHWRPRDTDLPEETS